MHRDARMPLARQHDLVATPSGGDLLVYDQARHHIHHLNRFAAAVWLACDGRQPVTALAATLSIELGVAVAPETVRLALAQLADANLLATPLADEDRVARSTRRHLLKAAAAGLAVPAIASVTAPDAAAQASCHGPFEACPNGCCYGGLTCAGGECCPDSLMCNGECCISGQCINGERCIGPQQCGDTCCAYRSYCVQGACCSETQVCGFFDVCCAVGEVCVDGHCQAPAPCAPGETLCGTTCVNTATDPGNCSSCGNICPAPPQNGSGICLNSGCIISCDDGYTLCAGMCIDTTSNPINCGSCGNVCIAPDGGSAACVDGACQRSCPAGYTLCGGTCCSDIDSRCVNDTCRPDTTIPV